MQNFQRLYHASRRTLFQKLGTAYDTYRVTKREKRQLTHVPISSLSRRSGVMSGIDVVCVCHNDIQILPSFLSYYRSMGITRFIFVDDASTDGTREYLLSQADVDLWTSPIRYAEARRGRQWREQLFEIYGRNRWYVNIDSDEFLVFSGSETGRVFDLIKLLESAGDKRLAAPMLDMYCGPIPGKFAPNDPPWAFSDHLDANSYTMTLEKRGVSITGGPRARAFGEQNELMKYPVIYWDDACYFGSSPHRPLPYGRNFPKTWGALLHFKFFVNYKEKISEAVQEKQHFGGSAHYVKLLEEINDKGEIDLYDENVSIKYTGSKQLEELGFITPIDWDKGG